MMLQERLRRSCTHTPDSKAVRECTKNDNNLIVHTCRMSGAQHHGGVRNRLHQLLHLRGQALKGLLRDEAQQLNQHAESFQAQTPPVNLPSAALHGQMTEPAWAQMLVSILIADGMQRL